MQRLFSSFPGGRPGVGLLLLRAAAGISLIVQGGAFFAPRHQGTWIGVAGPLAIATGACLLIGFLTPVASVLAALVSTGLALSSLHSSLADTLGGAPEAAVYLLVMTAALLLLGPGAFSLDARLFGRREIVIPHPSVLPPED